MKSFLIRTVAALALIAPIVATAADTAGDALKKQQADDFMKALNAPIVTPEMAERAKAELEVARMKKDAAYAAAADELERIARATPATGEHVAGSIAYRAWLSRGMKEEDRWVTVGQDEQEALLVDMAEFVFDDASRQALIVMKRVPSNPKVRVALNQARIYCNAGSFLMGKQYFLDDKQSVQHVVRAGQGALTPAAGTLPSTLVAWACR